MLAEIENNANHLIMRYLTPEAGAIFRFCYFRAKLRFCRVLIASGAGELGRSEKDRV